MFGNTIPVQIFSDDEFPDALVGVCGDDNFVLTGLEQPVVPSTTETRGYWAAVEAASSRIFRAHRICQDFDPVRGDTH